MPVVAHTPSPVAPPRRKRCAKVETSSSLRCLGSVSDLRCPTRLAADSSNVEQLADSVPSPPPRRLSCVSSNESGFLCNTWNSLPSSVIEQKHWSASDEQEVNRKQSTSDDVQVAWSNDDAGPDIVSNRLGHPGGISLVNERRVPPRRPINNGFCHNEISQWRSCSVSENIRDRRVSNAENRKFVEPHLSHEQAIDCFLPSTNTVANSPGCDLKAQPSTSHGGELKKQNDKKRFKKHFYDDGICQGSQSYESMRDGVEGYEKRGLNEVDLSIDSDRSSNTPYSDTNPKHIAISSLTSGTSPTFPSTPVLSKTSIPSSPVSLSPVSSPTLLSALTFPSPPVSSSPVPSATVQLFPVASAESNIHIANSESEERTTNAFIASSTHVNPHHQPKECEAKTRVIIKPIKTGHCPAEGTANNAQELTNHNSTTTSSNDVNGDDRTMTSPRWRKQTTNKWNHDDLMTYCGDLLAWQQRYRQERQQRRQQQQSARQQNRSQERNEVSITSVNVFLHCCK